MLHDVNKALIWLLSRKPKWTPNPRKVTSGYSCWHMCFRVVVFQANVATITSAMLTCILCPTRRVNIGDILFTVLRPPIFAALVCPTSNAYHSARVSAKLPEIRLQHVHFLAVPSSVSLWRYRIFFEDECPHNLWKQAQTYQVFDTAAAHSWFFASVIWFRNPIILDFTQFCIIGLFWHRLIKSCLWRMFLFIFTVVSDLGIFIVVVNFQVFLYDH